MAAALLPSANRAVLDFIAEALESANVRSRIETYIHEFEDCRYHLCRSKADPDCLGVSFKYSYPISDTARLALLEAYHGFATISDEPEADFQLTLRVSLPALRGQAEKQRQKNLEKLASIRMYITGAALRSMLGRLFDGTLTDCQEAFCCRPGQPFYVEGRPDRLTALFPVYLRGSSDDALATAFAQECAEARQLNSIGNGPQITFTHQGQAPLFDIMSHPCWKQSDRIAGYITLVILPAHVPSPERIDSVTWTLLTLPAHLESSIKAFKASLHEHLRGTYEEHLAQLQRARCDIVEGSSRQGHMHRATSVLRRAPTPVTGSLLDRIRAKAHAAPVRDMGSMLNRHKENVHVNTGP